MSISIFSGGDLADAKLQELVILPVEPTFKTSTDVFITKKNLDLRQDPPLDIQVKNFDLNLFNQILV